MSHLSKEYLDFFKGLSRNNTREWFRANKQAYEQYVRAPFRDFVDEMIHRIATLDPEMWIEPKDGIFRIARDIRFSKDKTPYKTFMAAVISRDGRKNVRSPGFYFQLGAGGLFIASGCYQPDKVQLQKIRRALVRDGDTFARLLRARAFVALYGELQGEKNKRLPPEFACHVEQHPFIANKQFYYHAEYKDPKSAVRVDLADFLMRHYKAARKPNAFLKEALAR